jgi:ribonuclease HII
MKSWPLLAAIGVLAENAAFLKAALDGVDREPVNDARPGVVGGTVVGTTVDLFTRERVLWDGGYGLIAGVDEVGRAAWAGPLVAAAVILPPDFHFRGIGDGKVLTAKQRERAHERVIAEATAWAICLEEAATINERGLHECNIDLLARAAHELKVPPDYVLVDGVNRPPDLRFPSEPIVRGDASSASIAAASIIAKVTRDRVMEELHATYPQYGFDRNRGYWSPAHMDALSRCGLTPVHRLNKGTKRWLRVPPLHRP